MKTLLFVLFFGMASLTYAQNHQAPADHTTNDQQNFTKRDYDWSWKTSSTPGFTPPPPDPIPVDGGVGFLIAAGLGYGLKRMRKKK